MTRWPFWFLLVILSPCYATSAWCAQGFAWDWSTSAPDTFQMRRCTAAVGQATCVVTADLAGGTVTGTIQAFVDNTTVVGTNYCWTVVAVVGGLRGADSNRICTPDMTNGLVLYYPMDAGAGSTVADSTSNANNGSLLSGATWAAGKWGTGVTMTGGPQGILTPASSTLNTMSALSWAAWVYVRTLPPASPKFADKGNDSATGWFLAVNYPLSTRILFNVPYSTQELQVEVPSTGLTLNGWHHLVVSWSGAPEATSVAIYIDGSVVAPFSTIDGAGTRISDNARALRTGTNEGGTDGSNMTIDELRVYNRALSPDDVALLYTFVPTTVAGGSNIVLRIIR